jgi:hypothetical protein
MCGDRYSRFRRQTRLPLTDLGHFDIGVGVRTIALRYVGYRDETLLTLQLVASRSIQIHGKWG